MAPRAKNVVPAATMVVCSCGLVLLMVLVVVLATLFIRLMVDLRNHPAVVARARGGASGAAAGPAVVAVSAVRPTTLVVQPDLPMSWPRQAREPVITRVGAGIPNRDVTDVQVLDQSVPDAAGPVVLVAEERLRREDPPVFPSQDPFYPLRDQPPGFQQLGVLTAMNEKTNEPIILPLFGQRIGNDRWNYYTSSDKQTLWRIPLEQKGRSCSDRYQGCPEVYDGDTIRVPAYQREFSVTLYPYRAPVF